jgi:hypothetical protein
MSKTNPTTENNTGTDGAEQSGEKIPRLLTQLLKNNPDVTVYAAVNTHDQYWVRFRPQHAQFEVAETGPGRIELQRVSRTEVHSLFSVSRVDLRLVEEATEGCRDIWALVDDNADQVELVTAKEESD